MHSTRKTTLFAFTVAAVVLVAVRLAVESPIYGFASILFVAVITLFAIKPVYGSPVLLTLAGVFARPNLLGSRLAPVSLGLVAVATLMSIVSDRGIRRTGASQTGLTITGWIGLSYLAIVLPAAVRGDTSEMSATITGFVLTVGTLACCVVILSDPVRRVLVAKCFVGLIAILSVSFVVTALFWAVAGEGFGNIQMVDTGTGSNSWPLFFPFTPTVGVQSVFGITVPRFTGLGREPGWMGMYTALAFFLAPKIGWKSRTLRLTLFAGLVGTFSTAGFAIFVVVLAYEMFLRSREGRSMTTTFLMRTVGLLAAGGAMWVAFNAPVLGLSSKVVTGSYAERVGATQAGIDALFSHPFSGGLAADIVGGVDLIATIALHGVLFAVAVALAIWLPRRHHNHRSATTASVAVIFLTLLLAQPPTDATWAYVCLMIAYMATYRTAPTEPTPQVSAVGRLRAVTRS